MKRICFLPVVLLLTGLLCGCTGQQQNDPSPQEHNHAMEEGTETPKYDHLTVYSPLPESETLLYCSAFRKDTGITVDCIYLPAGEMTARLEQERDNPQASVLLGGSADNYIQLREAGLLEAYQSPELTDVPEAIRMSRACGIQSTSARCASPATPTGLHGRERRCRPAGTICCRLHWQGRL